MAKQIWNKPIDKYVEWNGDESTNYAPVSGEMIQRFIKESLENKIGKFSYDETNNRYLVFADEFTFEEYEKDPTRTDLILGTFDAPFNYSAHIDLTSKTYNAVFLNSTGNYIDFTFDVVNKQNASTGENVTVTYTFIRNANKQVITETRKYGDTVHFNIDKYLGEGTNTIIVGVTGQSSLAATTVAITYQVVNLSLVDELNIAKCYNLTNDSKQVEVHFTLSGYGTKVVEWYLDGNLIPFVKDEDEVVDVSTSKIKYITLSNLSQGTHSLQFRAYTTINGERFYTDTLYRDLIVFTGSSNDTIVGIATTIPREDGILAPSTKPTLKSVQYVPYNFRFATYSPLNEANTKVELFLGTNLVGTIGSSNGIENTILITPKNVGEEQLKLEIGDSHTEYAMVVDNTTMNIQEIKSAILNFSAEGKSNTSDRDTWTDGVHTGVLTGFEWTNNSGWVNGRLEMNAGSSLEIDYAPFSTNPTITGKTIEIEWYTKNVKDDNAVICDLRNANGVGILITASKVSLTSADGVTVSNEYKSDENVRIGFVINKSKGVSNKRLSFIYTNGIISKAEQWAVTDSYKSDAKLVFTATEGAEVSLKNIRIYDTALSSDNMLNNYILYRDSVAEMMEVYYRNDVYEDGTTTFSPEKMMNRLPVMIVTGDIPTLENSSDKDTQIVVDIEYFNGTKSFTMKNAAMRPQGTSSMGYPKKNFRIYTQKIESTEVYDANGNLIEDKLYSFKDRAQPVNCWCLKADYAESSGTHNTGIARLWNEALFNAQIDNQYKLRTEAQKAALLNGYNYDVRTTIDGFPILLFYKKQANDDLIFIGKYNFNNDKSTEKVFGFTDIPGFDNSRMQCWEILNNGNALSLFTSTNNFDTDWNKAFESRYPDTKTPYTGDLKAFCQWMTNVKKEDFATQKWEHLDVYKMAAYWSYLMRFAAADQFVKNAMLTSEDGVKWYFILYDNDTINGLINTGHLEIKPTDNRQTKNSSGEYVFAGHDSRLWNMLEADKEFIQIVSEVDNALYSVGISYAEAIKVFDEEQADKWVERVYNQDAQYKYIGPYIEKGIDNLFMLQGNRSVHRKWWLAKRFSIYDAKYVSGTYKSQNIEVKCINGTEPELQFSITAGYPLDYGYGINNVVRASGITLDVGESYTFTTPAEASLHRGDPINIYGAPNLAEVDFSKMSDKLATVSTVNAYDANLGTKLRRFIVGNASKTNNAVAEISGLKQLEALQYLDIQGMAGIKSLDLSNHKCFETLKAFGSGISSVSFTPGAPVKYLELPSTMRVLQLEQLPHLKLKDIVCEDVSYLDHIHITECPNVTNDFNTIYNWYLNKRTDSSECSLVLDNVVWENIASNKLIELGNLGEVSLKGKITLTSITNEQASSIVEIFGENAFNSSSELYISAPLTVVTLGRSEILEGEKEQYKTIVIGEKAISITKTIKSGSNSYVSFNTETGLLTVAEGYGNGSIVIETTVMTETRKNVSTFTVNVVKRVYPTLANSSIIGSSSIDNERENYTFEYTDEGVTGEFELQWSITGLDQYLAVESSGLLSSVIRVVNNIETYDNGEIICKVIKKSTNSELFSVTKPISMMNINIAEIDAGVCKSLYDAGLCANETYITKEEAKLVQDDDLMASTSTSIFYQNRNNIKTFNGFKYFTSITKIPKECFYFCSSLTSIELPPNVKTLGDACFQSTAIESITIPTAVGAIPNYCFDNCLNLKSCILSENISIIGTSAFEGCHKLESIQLYEGINMLFENCFSDCSRLQHIYIPKNTIVIGNGVFSYCNDLDIEVHSDNAMYTSEGGILFSKDKKELVSFAKGNKVTDYTIPSGVTTLSASAFEGSNVVNVRIAGSVTKIPNNCFNSCKILETVELPSSVTSIGSSAFTNCKILFRFTIHASTAPTVTTSTFYDGSQRPSYTGWYADDGIKKLYVPTGATGYDTGAWLDPLCDSSKCGFTLSATL